MEEPTISSDEQALKDKWKKELEESAAVQEYFKGFNENSVRDFKETFLHRKYKWYKNEDLYARIQERRALTWITKAHEHLQIIQLKKLFDLQCLWQAEELRLHDIEISKDFERWERDILNCPLIAPITQDEIIEYREYLLLSTIDSEFQEWTLINCYPSHHEIIGYYLDGDTYRLPQWYVFHNAQHDTQHLFNLPNTRREKEEFYKQLYYKSREKAKEIESVKKPSSMDEKPILEFYNNGFSEWFIETFDTKKTLQLYRSIFKQKQNPFTSELSKKIEHYLAILKHAKAPPTMESGNNWVHALQKTATKYSNQQIARALSQAWDEYQLNLHLAIAFPVNEEELETHRVSRNEAAEIILKGRLANGEPADFNF